jgi:phosphocarrier protein
LEQRDNEAVADVTVPNLEGLHARPIMRFVDVASTFRSGVTVMNLSRRGERLDGKSAMHMMLLEATQGSVLRIEARGPDAPEAVRALTNLVETGFQTDATQGA